MNTDISPATPAASVSDLLSRLDLGGRNWSYVELGPCGGYSAPPSDAVYVHILLHGTARLAGISGDMITLTEGQAAIILSGESHALRSQSDSHVTPLDFLREDRAVDVPPTVALGTSGPVLARLLSARLNVHWPDGFHRSSLPSILQIDLTDEALPNMLLRPEAFRIAGFGPGSTALLTRLASLLLIASLRSNPEYLRLLYAAPPDPIDQALALISANPSAPWTVEQLARSVGMGRSNFAAHFTAQVGRAPMEVITDKRMDQALTLLRQSQYKIAEIAEITGYGSEAAFSRRFARHFGTPPSLMREQGKAVADQATTTPGWTQLLPRGRLGEASLHHQRKAVGETQERQPVLAPLSTIER